MEVEARCNAWKEGIIDAKPMQHVKLSIIMTKKPRRSYLCGGQEEVSWRSAGVT